MTRRILITISPLFVLIRLIRILRNKKEIESPSFIFPSFVQLVFVVVMQK